MRSQHMELPKRSREMAHLLAHRLMAASHPKEIDGCRVIGSPAMGVRIKNELGEECITWDSFCELWLRNIECDEPFVTKPQLLRKK